MVLNKDFKEFIQLLNENNGKYLIIIVIFIAVILYSCGAEPTPKPRGYFRIDLPERAYQKYESDCPYRFEYPKYALIKPDTSRLGQPCWIDVEFPQFNGRVHITYRDISNNMAQQMDDTHTLAYKHSIKADAIGEQYYEDRENRIFGVLYDIKGSAASPLQFFLTDSTRHFLRGALYFNCKPNKDSIAPVLKFVSEDVLHLIETFRWKE